ncbi:uncharacterized protein Nmlp_3435 [Natronomonas moolapensis 8.8.11]|uniref:Cox cluster protein n=1 Tax=Natronomonas moolapensis (strain DSM 18674 / CECT 7526 / JCM 14361 / 8.8.11) TaxID=268739 RepID=M1XT36_NATM8|nr:hypothetical protein [Natronomonas moolapensis]CCQ37562.1 uncharacterized protein Nmlp_3435 [Natronomonas moolapensis 8.8.11]
MATESERYDKTSPWPIVVVLGVVFSELGILFNVLPVAVAGLVVFVGSVSGIVHEAGYVVSPWRLLVGLGAALAVLGGVVVSVRFDGGLSASVFSAAAADGVLQRGLTVAVTGVVVSVAGTVLPRVWNQ